MQFGEQLVFGLVSLEVFCRCKFCHYRISGKIYVLSFLGKVIYKSIVDKTTCFFDDYRKLT